MLQPGHINKINWGHNLHRVGVLGDGSCFFHSLLFLINNEYVSASVKDKKQIVNDFRLHIANNLSVNDFMELTSNGTPLYKDLPPNVAVYNKHDYKLPINDVNRIKNEINNVINSKIVGTFTPEDFTVFFRNYLSFRDYIIDSSNWVGDELHPIISKILGLDIYIIKNDSDDKGFFFHNPDIAYKNRKSIILYNLNNVHWEPICRIYGRRSQSIFDPKDADIIELRKDYIEKWKILSS